MQPVARLPFDSTTAVVDFAPANGTIRGSHAADAFDPFRTGLDHLALEVSSRDELEAWMPHLVQLGVAYSPITDLGHASFICIKDPDGIPIELWHPLSLVRAH